MFIKQFDRRIYVGPDDHVRHRERFRNSVRLTTHLRMVSLEVIKSFIGKPDASAPMVKKKLHTIRIIS